VQIFKNRPVRVIVFLMLLLSAGASAFAQGREVPFTLDDRDRLIKLEERVNSTNERITSLEKSLDVKFDSMNSKLDDIKTFMYWGFGILFSMMMFLFGFVLWDRRTVLSPVTRRNRALEQALIEYSEQHPELKEILRRAAIL